MRAMAWAKVKLAAAVLGTLTVAASAVTPLYGKLDWSAGGYGTWSNALEESAPAQTAAGKTGAVLPVLLRVRVPADAKPGEYRGTVRVAAGGRSFDVPVELCVTDWQVPDPKDYRTYIGVYQSPASVAMQYGVKPWSEEHWKLLEKSFELLGRLGNKMVNVGVADETQFGEPEGMIWWVKKPDGGYDYDFTVFDRYVGLVLKHCGPQEFVCLQIWHAGGWSARPVNNKLTVQVVDARTGQRAPMQVPLWGTPEAAAFWKPFFERVQTRLARLGMDRAMTVGILSDSTAPDEVFRTMAAAFPGGKARWHRGCHSTNDSPRPYAVSSKLPGNEVTLHEHCYGMSMVHPDKGPPPVHTYRGYPGTAYFRISNHENVVTLVSYRTMAEQGLYCRKQGIGRICLDFWPVLKGARGSSDIYNRYPDSSCAQREPSLKKLAWAGPAGAGTSMRFEAFCEGIQEAEAVILLSEGAASEARVGAELAGKCRRLLVDRMWFCHGRDQHEWSYSYVHMNHHGWQELNRQSFDLAGEVARKLGK